MSPRIIKETETLGEKLRSIREAAQISREDLAHETQTPLKFVQALEEDKYEIFPARVYALGFLKKILLAIKAENSDSFLEEFKNEWDVRNFRAPKILTALPETSSSYPLITPAKVGLILGSIFLTALLIFFGSRITRFVGTPEFSLEEPKAEAVITGPMVRVKGKTEKESSLLLNGREIKIDESGSFNEEVEFGPGTQELNFLAKNRFGKETKFTRYIIIK